MTKNTDSDDVFDEEDLADGFEATDELEEVSDDLDEVADEESAPEGDEDVPVEPEEKGEATDSVLPKQDDEFRCSSCRLLKKTSQLADRPKSLCRDCV